MTSLTCLVVFCLFSAMEVNILCIFFSVIQQTNSGFFTQFYRRVSKKKSENCQAIWDLDSEQAQVHFCTILLTKAKYKVSLGSGNSEIVCFLLKKSFKVTLNEGGCRKKNQGHFSVINVPCIRTRIGRHIKNSKIWCVGKASSIRAVCIFLFFLLSLLFHVDNYNIFGAINTDWKQKTIRETIVRIRFVSSFTHYAENCIDNLHITKQHIFLFCSACRWVKRKEPQIVKVK